ncbi:hypothetical protein BgAZ_303230 [Babesia gibsoni]|uniref:Uncharacterized protein n=1 Tax=Babesia gibsoni TaxID=33632 RepID=A0AAD8LHL1_BABGI|nr:hypothetical protein BgAZ_303230 [Babesia gibsoni]
MNIHIWHILLFGGCSYCLLGLLNLLEAGSNSVIVEASISELLPVKGIFHLIPTRVKLSLQTNVSCDVYPADYQNASNVTLVCNSITLRSGAPLTLKLTQEKYPIWANGSSLKPTLSLLSGSSKTVVESIILQRGESQKVLLCLEESLNGRKENISCKQFNIRMFVKYFSIHSDFYYTLVRYFKYVSTLFVTKRKETKHGNSPLFNEHHGNDIKEPIIPEEGYCTLDADSARLCSLEVKGNAAFASPFDPYMSMIDVMVMCKDGDKEDDVSIEVPLQLIKGVDRKLTVSLGGEKEENLPKTIHMGALCKKEADTTKRTSIMVLKTFNERSGFNHFTFIRFVFREPKDYGLVSLIGSLTNTTFTKIEEIDIIGRVKERQYSYRRPHFTIRGGFAETRVNVNSNAKGNLSIFLIDGNVYVTINGVKIKSREYKTTIKDMKMEIKSESHTTLSKVIISSGSSSGFYNFTTALWWIYVILHACFLKEVQFLDSVVSYVFASFHFPMNFTGTPGSLLVNPLLIFVNDTVSTNHFADFLMLSSLFVSILLVAATAIAWPSRLIKKIRESLNLRLPYVAICCNLYNILMLGLHLSVYQSGPTSIFLLGYILPGSTFKYFSLFILSTTTVLSSYTSIKCFKRFFESKWTIDKNLKDISFNMAEAAGEGIVTRIFIEGGKLYKIRFKNTNLKLYSDLLKKHLISIRVFNVASISVNGHVEDSGGKFFSIKNNIEGFQGRNLVAELTLKGVEIISSMKKDFIIWYLPGGSDDKSDIGKTRISTTFVVLSSFYDLFCLYLSCLLHYLFGFNLKLTIGHVLLKWILTTITILPMYSHINNIIKQFSSPNDFSMNGIKNGGIIFKMAFYKFIRTVTLVAYICLTYWQKNPNYSAIMSVIQCWMFFSSFHIGFPILQIHKLAEEVSCFIMSMNIVLCHIHAMYLYITLRLSPGLLATFRGCCSAMSVCKPKITDDLNNMYHSATDDIITRILKLNVIDEFSQSYNIQPSEHITKYTFLHPSVYVKFGDMSPTFNVEGSSMNLIRNIDHNVEYGIINRATASTSYEYRVGFDKLPMKDLRISRETSNAFYSNVHVIYVDHGLSYTKKGNDRYISSNTYYPNDLGSTNYSNNVGLRGAYYGVTDGNRGLIGVIEWRRPLDTDSTYEVLNTAGTNKLQLYIKIGSLHMQGLYSSAFPTVITFDEKKKEYRIYSNIINPLERYSIKIMYQGDRITKYTNVMNCTTCEKAAEVEFYINEDISKCVEVTVSEDVSHENVALNHGHMEVKMDNSNGVLRIYNDDFKIGRKYTLKYQSTIHGPQVELIYCGLSQELFHEMTVPLEMDLEGIYDFIILNNGGVSKTIEHVEIHASLKDNYAFGMKSEIMQYISSVDLTEYYDGFSHFKHKTFHFYEKTDESTHSKSVNLPISYLKVNECQYLLGENISFLVPVTVVQLLKGKHGNHLYRVIPHYDVLASDLKQRINRLYYVLRYIQLDLLLYKGYNNRAGKESPTVETVEDNKTDKNISVLLSSSHANEQHMNIEEPDELFMELLVTIFSNDSLRDHGYGNTNSLEDLDVSFIFAVRTVIIFCIKQLEEAVSILLRQHEMANSIPVKIEMQRFDTFISQGMMVERATSMLKNTDKFNVFLAFPFVLKIEEIHSRVNVEQELKRLTLSVSRQFYSKDTIKPDPFIKSSLSRYLMKYIDLKEMHMGLCHIIVPDDGYDVLATGSMYCFLKMVNNEDYFVKDAVLWKPCIVSFNWDMMRVMSPENAAGETPGNFDFIVLSLEQRISQEGINLLGNKRATDNNLMVELTVEEMNNGYRNESQLHELATSDTMVLRCNERYYHFFHKLNGFLNSL